MKFASILGLAGLIVFATGCKDDAPGYCTEDYFGEAYMTDALGETTTTFGIGSTINLNELLINTYSDSIFLNYSEPLVTYEVATNVNGEPGQIMTTNNTGVGSMASANLAPNDTISSFYPYSQIHGNLPPGNYILKVGIEYQYMRDQNDKLCENGLVSKEQLIEFTIQ